MTGWMQHKLRVSVLLWLFVASVQADEQETAPTAVDEDFLLFLGDWEDEQGHWQDPLEYEDEKWTQLDDRQVTDDEYKNAD